MRGSTTPLAATAGARAFLIGESLLRDGNPAAKLPELMRALDGVVSTETFLYLQMVKQLYDWGTRVGEAN